MVKGRRVERGGRGERGLVEVSLKSESLRVCFPISTQFSFMFYGLFLFLYLSIKCFFVVVVVVVGFMLIMFSLYLLTDLFPLSPHPFYPPEIVWKIARGIFWKKIKVSSNILHKSASGHDFECCFPEA